MVELRHLGVVLGRMVELWENRNKRICENCEHNPRRDFPDRSIP